MREVAGSISTPNTQTTIGVPNATGAIGRQWFLRADDADQLNDWLAPNRRLALDRLSRLSGSISQKPGIRDGLVIKVRLPAADDVTTSWVRSVIDTAKYLEGDSDPD